MIFLNLTLFLLSTLFLKKNNEPFILENEPILTRKFNKTFLLKLSYQNSFVKFDAFQRETVQYFFLNNEALRNKRVKLIFNFIQSFSLLNYSKLHNNI